MYGIILYLMLPLTVVASRYSELVTDLLKNYTKDIRPDCGKPVVVYIDMALRQIQEVSEQKQILTTNAWLRFGWNDCNLSWNESKYDGISKIYLPEEKIWFPDICLYDNAEYMLRGLNEYYRVHINSSGFIQYNFPSQLYTSCTLNIRYFPFDLQICKITFGSWSYNDYEVTVVNQSDSGDNSSYLINGEWDLIDFTVQTTTKNYTCCKEPYSTVNFEIKIRRKAAVYLLNLICPSILVSAIGLLGFFIPSESGEKISISVTVLLSLAVFHIVISEILPPNSDSLPYLGYFFLANMVFVGFCCTMSIIILNIYYTKTENSSIVRIIRYLKSKGRSLKVADKTTYDVTTVSAKRIGLSEAQPTEDCIQANKRKKQQCQASLDISNLKESLMKELLHEIEKSLPEKKKAEELKAEIKTAEIYFNRFSMVIAIILFLSLTLMLVNLT